MEIKDSVKSSYHDLLEQNSCYYSLLESDFKIRLTKFLNQWEPIRAAEKAQKIPFAEYPQLPFAPSIKHDFEWKWRKKSWAQLLPILKKNKTQKVLEIGSWNGWLSNQLCACGYDVLALDFFSDESDGLASKKHYPHLWDAIQCNAFKPDFLNPVFDTIIVNHCLQFSLDPFAFCTALQKLLLPGGKIIVLGVNFYKNPVAKINSISAVKEHYMRSYNFEIFLQDTKAYLDFTDKFTLEKMGFNFIPQVGMELRNFYAQLFPKKPQYYFGLYVFPLSN